MNLPKICENCGNDEALEGYRWCSDCIEECFEEPGVGKSPRTNSRQAHVKQSPTSQTGRVQHF